VNNNHQTSCLSNAPLASHSSNVQKTSSTVPITVSKNINSTKVVVSEIETPVKNSNCLEYNDRVQDESDSEVEVDFAKVTGKLQYIVGRTQTKTRNKLPLLLDSGAEINLIDSKIVDSLQSRPKKVKNSFGVQSISEHSLNCKGFINLPIALGKATVVVPFFAIQNLPYPAIISAQFLQSKGARLDFSRNVLDFCQDEQYSGPIP